DVIDHLPAGYRPRGRPPGARLEARPALPARLERLLRAHPTSAHAQVLHLSEADLAAPPKPRIEVHPVAA
ncbi:MAG TPA: hypothetical protein VFG86_19120, partial [Chloroflexota bacterium]|nr:hypothetical protein [Chloroflexota bacterium]